jgi:hypothetical protein
MLYTRLNMELDLQSLLGSCVQLYSLAETPQLPPSPRIWAHILGRYWSAKVDAIHCVTPWLHASVWTQEERAAFQKNAAELLGN